MEKNHTSAWYDQRPDMTQVPKGALPPDRRVIGTENVPLRVFLHYRAWDTLHSLFSYDEEQIGVLLGQVRQDGAGPFVLIQRAVPAPHTRRTGGSVTFSERSWAALRAKWQRRDPDLLVVGGFRVRPGGGTRLSAYDRFDAQRHFPHWHQIVYVVDPQGQRQGLFHWRDGRLQPLSGFWVFEDGPGPEPPTAPAPHGAASGVHSSSGPTPDVVVRGDLQAPSSPEPVQPRPLPLALLIGALLLLLPWACAPRLPGSLPALRRALDGAEASHRQLVEEARVLRKHHDALRQVLDGAPPGSETGPFQTPAPSPNAGTSTRPDASPGTPDSPPSRDAAGFVGPTDSYVVRPGDTLWAISGRLLGDPYGYKGLAEENDIPDPNLILPGWKLRVPVPTPSPEEEL